MTITDQNLTPLIDSIGITQLVIQEASSIGRSIELHNSVPEERVRTLLDLIADNYEQLAEVSAHLKHVYNKISYDMKPGDEISFRAWKKP